MMLVDLNAVNPDDELEFTEENALVLMKNSTEFDSFASDITVTYQILPNASKELEDRIKNYSQNRHINMTRDAC